MMVRNMKLTLVYVGRTVCLLFLLAVFLCDSILAQSNVQLDSLKSDSLEFESRFELYRYLQRGLEEYFDGGDSAQLLELNNAAQFVFDRFGDDFYIRQCAKFSNWRSKQWSARQQLKLEFTTNQMGLGGEPKERNRFVADMRELAERFLALGDSSSAVNCWHFAGASSTDMSGAESLKQLLDKAITVSRMIGDQDGLSRGYSLVGRFHEQRGEFLKAGDYFDSARVIKTELGDRAGTSDALFNIASVYLSIGDKTNSLRFAEQALQLRREIGDSTKVIQSLLMIIPAFARDVSMSAAQEWLSEARQLSQRQLSQQQNERFLYCSAVVAELEGEVDSALSQYSTALEMTRKSQNSRLALAILQNIASLESAMGRFTEAMSHYVTAQEIAASTRNRIAQATIYHNLGSLHQRLGDLEQASDYYRRALEIRNQFAMRIQSAETLSNLAELFMTTGDLATAEVYVRQALQIAELAGDNRRLASSLTHLAHLRQLQGDHSGAMSALDSAESIGSESQSVQRRIDFLCLRAEFSRQNRSITAASKYLAEAKSLLDSCSTYSNVQRVEIINAALAADQKQWLSAFHTLAGVIARSEQSRGSIPDPQLRTSFQGRSRFVYEQMVTALYHLRESGQLAGAEDSLLVYIEKAKSRGLLDALGSNDEIPASPAETKLKKEELRLLRSLEQIEQTLADDGDGQSIKRKLASLQELELQLANLRLKQSLADPGSERSFAPSPMAIRKIQKTLPDARTALMSFLLAPDAGYVVRIDQKQIAVYKIAGRSEITNLVSEFARLIQTSIKDESLLDNLSIIAEALGEQLLPDSVLPLGDYDHILVSADGILNVLPFEALRRDSKYLIEYASVASIPSLFLYSSTNSKTTAQESRRLLALADPRNDTQQKQLPFSVREVDWISDIFGKSNCTILTAADATKSELLKLRLSDYDIVHVATHSTINYNNPRRSKIWLSTDTLSTDFENALTLAEISELNLSADLVVLSSCESGGGKLDIGEGIEGFVKAFMQAGARNMLVSLWEVEDFTTATFMKTFYENINKGYAEALRSAKLEMIASPRLRHRHPYYWSPFKLTLGESLR